MKEEIEKWERVPSWRVRRGREGGKKRIATKLFVKDLRSLPKILCTSYK